MSNEDSKLFLPETKQIGIVVRDLDKSVAMYSKMFGMNCFSSLIFKTDKHWLRGKIFPIELKVAHLQVGSIDYELIEPVSDSPHKWFLDAHGEGLHHLGYQVENYDVYLDATRKMGLSMLMNAVIDLPEGHVRAAYFESKELGNVLLEIFEIKKI